MAKINFMVLLALFLGMSNVPLCSAELNSAALAVDSSKKYKFAATAFLAMATMGRMLYHGYQVRKEKKVRLLEQWKTMIEQHRFEACASSGYMHVVNRSQDDNKIEIMKGKRSLKLLVNPLTYDFNYGPAQHWLDKSEKDGHIFSGQYKIHLMPTDKNINDVLQQFLELLTSSQELQGVINEFKIYASPEKTMGQAREGNESVAARMVIYPADGKKSAQKALDIIYEKFQDVEGINITPRFNAKVTSLIYVSQGDADFKMMQFYPISKGRRMTGWLDDHVIRYPVKTECAWQDYYERPHKVYYNERMPLEPGSVDHYLRFPGTDRPIIDVE